MSSSFERDYFIDRTNDRGYVTVPFALQAADIDPLFDQFREVVEICYQPGGETIRQALTYKPTNPADAGDYYIDRRRIGEINPASINQTPATEDKDTAHIGPRSLERASHQLGGRMPGILRKFIGSCIEVHEATKNAARPYFKALNLDQVMLDDDPMNDVHVVRLLDYPSTNAVERAGLHFDRSTFTLAAWESHPGLIGAPGQNAYRQELTVDELESMAVAALHHPIKHRNGSAKLFLGAGYNRLPQNIYDINGSQSLLLHGVKNERPGQARGAVVVFMNPSTKLKDYRVPTGDETGIEGIYRHITQNQAPCAEAGEVA